jgi:suppressor of ftsI
MSSTRKEDIQRLNAHFFATTHGLQDTVPVPVHGEVVIRIAFKDFTRRFIYHCHILFHGDGGMMGVIQVYK